ncbi:uncharacterized protein FOMMEDRAFT_22918 [Fomitiporia mediterranea MF3/22]|uniref:uncharacterized protein n=1 Tax=Fomitiporia mediterranea (strain MF3/22) TaxID=694068 RepID=UPI00044098BD|nr:uncharacterized protein FOMMEDRAFT_22918 [Fomitiporia mediterranea MF3/22]EJC99907.1 hypothetical protein FOMMEDRAFT_22918 [Fomitiporia mediterranea MF3/22]
MSSSSQSTTKPDLKTWTQERLKALYTAPDDDAFHSAFESAFAPEGQSTIVINGKEMPREKLKDEIKAQRAAMTKVNVEFHEPIEDAETTREIDNADSQPGIVKGSWTVTRSLRFKLRGAPDQMRRISQFEAKVEPLSPGSDEYRIVHLAETVEVKRPPIQLLPASLQQTDQAQ